MNIPKNHIDLCRAKAALGNADGRWRAIMTAPVSPVSPEELKRLAEEAGFDISGKEITIEDFICTEEVAKLVELVRSGSAPAASGATPEGWKLVPIEPTQEMLLATRGPNMSEPTWRDYALKRHATIYRAMIAAAPLPPDPNLNDDIGGKS